MHGRKGVTTEKAKDFKGTLKKLLQYVSRYKITILIVILFAIASTAFSIIGPKILGNATTEIFNGLVRKIGGGAGIDFGKISGILLTLLGLYLASLLFSFLQGYLMSGVSQKISYNLRKEISDKMHRLPLKYYDKTTNGEVLSRVTNDVDTLSQNLNQSVTQVITSIATIIGVFIMMLSISPLMTVVAFLILPASMLLVSGIVKKSQKYFIMQQAYQGNVFACVEEVYAGHTIVKAFNAEEEERKRFDTLNKTLYKSAWKSQFLSGLMMPVMTFIGNISYVVVSLLGGWLVIKGQIEVGSIQSFIQYVRSFNQPISQIGSIANLLQSTAAAAERVFEFLAEEEEIQTVENPVSSSVIDGSVTFDHVHFGYNEDKIIINDFNAEIKPGQKVAIVGPTGAGKTTMVKLLMRFYDVNSGAIRLSGHNIKDFNRNDFRTNFGMVLQDTWLFNDTIKENIRYGKLEANSADIKAACKAAHVDHFIQTLSEGYHTVLEEDATNISQGQKQLLTIARVILADPKILILDEATSSVDTRTEILIQEAMDHLMEGRTSFIIAHRLSTIKNADLIIVMNEGDIVETGKHEELLKKDGFYAKLYNSQFEEA